MSFDPHYSSVALLLHCDGADGSTTFTDNSPSSKTITAQGGANISTAQSKFGGASARFNSTVGSLEVASSADFSFGAGDFCLELQAYRTGAGNGDRFLIDRGNGTSFLLRWNSSGYLQFFVHSSLKIGVAFTFTTGQFYHIAVTRSGTTVRLFIDGVQVGSGTSSENISSASDVSIGALRGGSQDRFEGYIDEVRVTKGVARYTSDFTPQTAAFPDVGPDVNYAIASAPSPLGVPEAVAKFGHSFHARTSSPGPLGAVEVLASVPIVINSSAPTPLGAISALARTPFHAWSSAPSPLGVPFVLGNIPTTAKSSAPSPLSACASVAFHDFTGQIGDTVTRYVMDLITPSGTVRVPISSWQATLRTGGSSYVQCVIPAAQPWGATINAATSFRIYRRAVTTSGQVFEYLMAEAPADTTQFDRGPTNPTCTLSGYAPGFAGQDVSPGTDRTLTGIRSISSGASYRVRCAVDWLLRPGQRGAVDGVPFVVEWINYYVNTADAYMEVGT